MIIPYQDSYQQELIDFILSIQQDEFGVDISLKDQPDLLAIKEHYQDIGGQFWIALDDDKVVGCIALVNLENGNVALKKMFVARGYRGTGLAKQLMTAFKDWCHHINKNAIYLGTHHQFERAQYFYQKQGFVAITKENLPKDFPLLEVDDLFLKCNL